MDIVLEKLSHWGRVAFAARCARRAMPLFDRGWPEASAERREELEQAIRLTELSVANAAPAAGLKELSLKAGMTAGRAIYRHHFKVDDLEEPEPTPADPDLAALASLAANVARHAADAALGDRDRCLDRVKQAYNFTLNAIIHAEQHGLIELLEQDYVECRLRYPCRPWWQFW